jgi:alginate O-acetyltransferase complex protein AlgI
LAEKLFLLGVFEKLPCGIKNIVKHTYTLFLTVIGFTIFNATDISEIGVVFSSMFGINSLPMWNDEVIYYAISYAPLIVIASICSTPIIKRAYAYITSREAGSMCMAILKPISYIVILIICTASLIDGSFNPFIYFRF